MARASSDDPADDRLRSLAFAVVGAGVLITDPSLPDNPIIDVNPAFERITGYAREEVLGRNCRFLQAPDTDPAAVARIREAIAAGRDVTETLLNERKDGTPFWNELCITPVRDASGAVTHFVGVQTDVTGRVRAEEQARLGEARYRALVERVPAVVYTCSAGPESVLLSASPGLERLYGHPFAAWRDDPDLWPRVLHPDDRARALAMRDRSVATGEPFEMEYRLRTRDGEYRWVHDETVLVREGAGRPLYRQGLLRDITAQKRIDADLKASEERYRTLVERLPVVHFTSMSAELGTPSFIGPQLEDLTGYTPDEWRADPHGWMRALHPDDRDRVLAEVAAANATGGPMTSEHRLITRDGRVVWVRSEAILVRDEHGTPHAWHGFMLDVTERRRAEDELRAEADRLAAVVDMQAAISASARDPEAVMRLAVARVMDLTGVGAAGISILEGDNAVYRVVAGTAREIEGVPFPARGCISGLSLLTGEPYRIDDSEADPRADIDIMRTAGVRSLLTTPLRFEDGIVGALAIGSPEPYALGEREEHLLALVAGMIASALAHATALEAAQAAEARFRSLVENAPDLVLVLDADGTVRFASPAIERVLGYEADVFVGGPRFDLVHPGDRADVEAIFGRIAVTPGAQGNRIMRMRHADGSWRWLDAIGQNRLDDPAVAGIVINYRHITEHVLAEQALRESEARLNAAQAIAHVGSWEWDIPSRTLRWSDEMYRLHGMNPAGGITIDRFIASVHPEDRQRVEDVRREDGLPTEPTWLVYRVMHPGGDVRMIESHGEAELDARGTPVKVVGTCQDVTERTRWEEQLVAARDAAEEASRLKSAFLSTMSHELRTPLTAIMGYSNLLLEGISGDLNPMQAADVGLIAAGADRLLALINDVLDLSRMGAGMLALEPARVDLAALVGNVAAEVAPQAARQGLAVDIAVPSGLTIEADPLRLHQVLLNLVGNAVKFTEAGRIAISARRDGDRVEIAVSDTGIGVAPEALPRIFDEFRQADERTTRRFGGSGLGLAIARRLVELHGGTIEADSTPGVGSTFTVVLPADGAARPPDQAGDAAPVASASPGRTSPLS